MDFPEILHGIASKLLMPRSQDHLSTEEKYLHSYCDAVLRFLRSFEVSRLAQIEIAKRHSNGISSREYNEMQGRERQCVLAIEAAYTYLHRIELIVRPGQKQRYDMSSVWRGTEPELSQWLSDFYFMSEFRNKLIEHAPERLAFHSSWTHAIKTDKPFDFRVLILAPNAFELLHHDPSVLEQTQRVCKKIWAHKQPNPDRMFGVLEDIRDGAIYLSKQEIRETFEVSLTKVGCISHTASEIAAKLHNIVELIFSTWETVDYE